MPDPLLPEGDGHARLTEEDSEGLLLSYVTTRGELNDAEQRSIAAGTIRRRSPTTNQLLDDRYLRDLHAAMFGSVWAWAGHYRRRETNIGVDPTQITSAVRNLVDDSRAWVEHTTYPPDELALRFHHTLVAIHPFPNGNGRHGRTSADYQLRALGADPFTWGAEQTVSNETVRHQYLRALRAADALDMAPLLVFARS